MSSEARGRGAARCSPINTLGLGICWNGWEGQERGEQRGCAGPRAARGARGGGDMRVMAEGTHTLRQKGRACHCSQQD